MKQLDLHSRAPRVFSPERVRLEKLLLFWGVCILLPAAAIFSLLGYSQQNARMACKAKTIDSMLSSAEILQQSCQQEDFFSSQIIRSENTAGLPPENSPFTLSEKLSSRLPWALKQAFSQLNNFKMVLLLTANADFSDVQIFDNPHNFPDYPKPGKRAATMVMKEYVAGVSGFSTIQTRSVSAERLLKNFTVSIFGAYLNPFSGDQNLISGFSERFGGSRVFIARRIVFASDGKPLFAYIAMFRESGNSLQKSFSMAVKQLAASGFSYRLIMRKAIPFPFVFEGVDGALRLFVPLRVRQLQGGVFDNKDLTSYLIGKGIMRQKPAIYPHFEICASAGIMQKNIAVSRHGFVIFLFLCLSLLLLKHFHQHGMVRVNIRGRLFFSVFLATALPAAVFIFYSHKYIEMRFELRKTELARKLKSHLKLLELSIKAKDEANSAAVFAKMYKVKAVAKHADAETLNRLFDKVLDSTFAGVTLIRSDGLFIERLDLQKAHRMKISSKVLFSKELAYATIIRFFQVLNLMQEKFTKQLQATSRGKKLLAFATVFDTIDIDNFCCYEGVPQTSKNDFDHFRLLNYKVLPSENDRHSNGVVFLLIQDIKEVARQILDDFALEWSFFRPTSSEGAFNVSFLSCLDLDGSVLETGKTWPPAKNMTAHELILANGILRGKSEMEFIDENGSIPVVLAGRKIAGYPLIALAECRMNKLAEQRVFWGGMVGCVFLYILLVLSLLSHILNELFIPPIDGLLTAARLTGEGQQVFIENTFDNELALLTGEFNAMNRQIRERERLERFISREAAMTIVSESASMQEIKPQKVKRSVLFIHIKKFSELNAKLTPDELIKLLNCWFPFIESIVETEGGHVDKYVSDAVMAVFSDRREDEIVSSSAVGACLATIKLKKTMPELNLQLLRNSLPELEFGAGIATGEVISGRIGSYQSRLDYTVIGDHVNLAARLESISHFDNESHILVDAATSLAVSNVCKTVFHGEISVKGKALPVKTYELIS